VPKYRGAPGRPVAEKGVQRLFAHPHPAPNRRQRKFDTKQMTRITHATVVNPTASNQHSPLRLSNRQEAYPKSLFVCLFVCLFRGTQFGKGPHSNTIVTNFTPGTDHHHYGLRAGHTIEWTLSIAAIPRGIVCLFVNHLVEILGG
jgi:hypothetical protein